MKTDDEKIFPEVPFQIRWLFSVEVVILRPFTMRQLAMLRMNLADPIQLATRRNAKWIARLRKKQPAIFQLLIEKIQSMNGWDAEDMAKRIKASQKSGGNESKPLTLFDIAEILIEHHHDPDKIWDYTPELFTEFASRAVSRDARERAAETTLNLHMIRQAVWGDKNSAMQFLAEIRSSSEPVKPREGVTSHGG